MYLKSLEVVGFKSFADKTKLVFEPGMTAIVGPNGCGKSNVADSVRWVLGEQSAKALRGSKMEDVIFNGTDTHKPMGMAEVSLTLADCEKVLGVDFNEVTITRRVYRSGEGQYFINKAPCRLKDIQRLFMDTGIGTNAYSLMEQGRIDKILSSHPEDRRAVFEEASGITKYKADKKEALRKLEQTEANLLRLDDIIKEVKRQIISLQRQAGKAKRYQELQGRLRSLDLYASRERLRQLDADLQSLEARIASIVEQDEAVRHDVAEAEQQTGTSRDALSAIEKEISDNMEAAVRTRTELDRVRELLRNNQDRIQELTTLAERDTRDAEGARARLGEHQAAADEVRGQLELAVGQRKQAEESLTETTQRLNDSERDVQEASRLLNKLRSEQIDLESRVATLQNELSALDAEERTNVLRRERLAAEHAETQRSLELFNRRQAEMEQQFGQLQADVQRAVRQLETFQQQRADKTQAVAQLKQQMGDLKAKAAAKQAQLDMLRSSAAEREGYPAGARLLLDGDQRIGIDRRLVLGPLAELVRAEPAYHLALEAVLRPWLDAVVLADAASALQALQAIATVAAGPARLLAAAGGATPAAPPPGPRLLDHVQCSEELRPMLELLLGRVVVVDDLKNLPTPLPADTAYVTAQGCYLSVGGGLDYWKRENLKANPLARQQLMAVWQSELDALQAQSAELQNNLHLLSSEEASVASAIEQSRRELEDSRRKLAQAEGENRVVSQEAKQARQREETVAWELKKLEEQQGSGGGRRAGILGNVDQLRARQAEVRTAIGTKTDELRDLEQARSACLGEMTDRRVRFAEAKQQVDGLLSRKEQLGARIQELTALIDERSRGISTYQQRIAELAQTNETSAQRIPPLEEEVNRLQAALEAHRQHRAELLQGLATLEAALRAKRTALDEIHARRSQAEVELAQQRMRQQNLIERVCGEYKITVDEAKAEPEPDWGEGGQPDKDVIDNEIGELRAKIDAMGPVNLVAIEEHRELEERFTFLTQQQTDLVNARQQLLDMIRHINKTTTEMFAETFNKVNTNFQEMFAQLFGGGTAKLVMVDENDVLESGIEIIARPPGKKLQSVSLLSGGERTMTAVALLFSLYMVKPSPFCVLDELDAALDEANIGRFVSMVQGFLERSQFVVITHNRRTISAATALYGVTMQQQGISSIVSVKFSDHEEKTPPAPAEKATVEAPP